MFIMRPKNLLLMWTFWRPCWPSITNGRLVQNSCSRGYKRTQCKIDKLRKERDFFKK